MKQSVINLLYRESTRWKLPAGKPEHSADRVTVLQVLGNTRESQQLYLAQQEKTRMSGLLVMFNLSVLTRGQLRVISQLSAER